MGRSTTASGNNSTAMGYYTEASGNYSTTIGQFTTASGLDTTIGQYTTAIGWIIQKQVDLTLQQWGVVQ